MKKGNFANRPHIDLKGKTFWDLKVLKRDWIRGSRAYAYWICECSCGVRVSKRSDVLRKKLMHACPNCVYKYYEEEYNERIKSMQQHFDEKYGKKLNKDGSKRRRRGTKTKRIKLRDPVREVSLNTGEKDALNQQIIFCRICLDMPIRDIADYLNCKKKYTRHILCEYHAGKITYREPKEPIKRRFMKGYQTIPF